MSNSAPMLLALSMATILDEEEVNYGPRLLFADARIEDAEDNFDGGELAITGLATEEIISVRDEGSGTGKVGFDGTNVSYGGVVIGTVAGGNGADFTVSFNAAATSEAISALLRNITYQNISDTPAATMDLSVSLSDASGATALVAHRYTEMTGAANPLDGESIAFGRSAPVFVDLDGDGDMDMVSGGYLGQFAYFRNDGTSIAPSFVEITGSANPFDGFDVGYQSKPTFVDLDGDGDMDMVSGADFGTLVYYRNDGTSIAPAFVEIVGSASPFDGIDIGSSSAPTFADIDGDGDADLVVGDSLGTLVYYRNDGTATAPSFTLVTGSANPFDGIDVGSYSVPLFTDIDNDGNLDLLVGRFGDGLLGDGNDIYLYRNDGTATAPSFTLASGALNPFSDIEIGHQATPALADLDGDGDDDLLIGNQAGEFVYHRNDVFTGFVLLPRTGAANPLDGLDAGDYSKPTFVDLDGDGDLDMVSGESLGTLKFYRNDGSAAAPSFVEITGSASPFDGIDIGFSSTPTFADIDGDGDADLVIGDNLGSLTFYRNDGTSTAPSFTQVTGSSNPFDGISVYGASTPVLVDFDGDGDLDLIVSANNLVHYWRNDGTITSPSFTRLTGAANPFDGIYGYEALLHDVDGDGDFDLILRDDDSYTLAYWRNDGTATAPSFTATSGGENPFEPVYGSYAKPALADLDGDGDPDLVVGEIGGTFDFYENDPLAQPSFTLVFDGSANPVDGITGKFAFADIDGDGDLDLLAGNSSALNYYRNDGDVTAPSYSLVYDSTNPFIGVLDNFFNRIGSYYPVFTDLDSDGDIDLILGRGNGELHYWRNDGSATVPSYTKLTGSANPFDGVVLLPQGEPYPTFADMDGDGDLDLLVGGNNGYVTLEYWRNDGTATSPSFTKITGSANPFDGIVATYRFSPELVDLDGDGDFDLVDGYSLKFWLNDGTATTPSFVQLTGADDPLDGMISGLYTTFADLDGDGDLEAISQGRYYENTGTDFRALATITPHADPSSGADVMHGSSGDDTIDGLGGNDVIRGLAGNDTLLGNNGNDLLEGGDGDDVLNGGNGADTASYTQASAGVTVLLFVSGQQDTVGAGRDTLISIENVSGSIYDDMLYGDFGANVMYGNAGNDMLYGYSGNDTLKGGDGADHLFGYDGADALDGGADSDVLFGGTGNDTLSGGDGDDGLSGGDGNDNLYGDAGVDWLYGNSNDDILNGGLGNDALFGEDGYDELYGGPGDDNLDGGADNDWLEGHDGADWLYGGSGSDSLEGGLGDDVLFGGSEPDELYGHPGNDSLDGGAHNDFLYGDAGMDWLYGGDGNDTLNGEADNDVLFGQVGNDTLNGGTGDDSLDGGIGADTLNGGAGMDWLYGQDGDDTLDGGADVDALFGGLGNDTLQGGAGNDGLYGGDGDDLLDGGEGNADALTGGAGADTFYFAAPDQGGDVILDFASGEDVIGISATGFGLSTTGALPASMFETGAGLPASFSASGPVFYYETGFGGLWFDPTGGNSADVVIVAGLATGTLAQADIVLM